MAGKTQSVGFIGFKGRVDARRKVRLFDGSIAQSVHVVGLRAMLWPCLGPRANRLLLHICLFGQSSTFSSFALFVLVVGLASRISGSSGDTRTAPLDKHREIQRAPETAVGEGSPKAAPD